ncbi:hypothetical protein FS749_000272, partial [Ceratobasidium sp. UAMH 11750]
MNLPWYGRDKIIIGIHIGVTDSNVSFALLSSGRMPQIQRVTAWPGRESARHSPDEPCWIWYDSYNKPRMYGSEAVNQAGEAAEQEFNLVKHFQLYLHPDRAAALNLAPLPAGISITQVYTDYLRHIFRHTQNYFSERMFDGQRLWQSLASSMDIVMTHPSGWGTSEQRVLRSATMAAVPDSVQQILLISETEVLIQTYLNFPEMSEPLTPGANLVVCNAGRFIVETTIYKVTRVSSRPHLEQVGASACIRAGSIFMDEAAESYLRQKLQSADLDVEDVDDYTQAGLEYFS